MSIKTFTGIASERRNGWWAQCDQLPVAAHGESYNEALQNMIESIELYYGALNGDSPPKPQRLPRGNGAFGFSITVGLP